MTGASADPRPEPPPAHRDEAAANRRKGRGELGTRFVFGPAMLVLIAADYWLDSTVLADLGHRGVLTAGVLGLLGLLGVHEYVVMMRKGGHPIAGKLLPLFSVLLLGSPFLFGWQSIDRELYPMAILTLGLLYPSALASLARERMSVGLERQGATLLGFLMLVWPIYLAQGMAIRHLPSVMFVVLVCKLGDIGGYLTGVAFGRHKLIPHISGGKTVEGSLGSLACSIGASVGLSGLLLEPAVPVGLTVSIVLGIILNVTTQTGDLVESLLKRRCGVKDSSALLPAHGGVLDLTDSLLFSFPAYFVVLVVLTP